ALREQRRVHRPVGEILLSLGFVTQDEIASVMAESHGVPLVAMEDLHPDMMLVAALDAGFVQETGAFPIAVNNGVLDVVMTDPGDPEKVSAVRRIFPYPLNISMITAGGLTLMLRKYLSSRESPVARILNQAKEEASDRAPVYPIEDLAYALIQDGVRRGATDIHFEPEEYLTRVRLRVDGVLQAGESLPKETTEPLISRIKILSDLDISEKRRPQDGRMRVEVDGREVDLRVSLIPTTFGENLVLRVLDRSSGTVPLGGLGFGPSSCKRLQEVCDSPHGIFLVTGPTGSGKTTTLYSLLSRVDALSRNVATVEDPVEYQVPLVRQSQVESSIGFGFLEGLRSLLRQDPDVILVGEIRDSETAEMAIKAAMTGHLVLSTLHTNSAIGAIPRLMDLGISPYLLEDSILGVAGQRLVRKVCSVCAEPYEPTADEVLFLEGIVGTPRKGKGCDHCGHTGLSGRLVLEELFTPDKDFGRMLRSGAGVGEILEHAKSMGFHDLTEDGRIKVRAGITTIEEVLRVAPAIHI
ncbi:MAG: type II/IV secretion system protein, partial [Planctomycetes bacterium]|nr:type II/IV secretion system protein [Planctomycetota bacterium]